MSQKQYRGKHIGALRFRLIEKTAQSALDGMMQQEQRNKQPLSEQELQQLNEQIAQQEREKQQRQLEREQHPWHQQSALSDNELSL